MFILLKAISYRYANSNEWQKYGQEVEMRINFNYVERYLPNNSGETHIMFKPAFADSVLMIRVANTVKEIDALILSQTNTPQILFAKA